jgi:hypothetical protein
LEHILKIKGTLGVSPQLFGPNNLTLKFLPELKGYVPSHHVSPQLNFKAIFKTYHLDHYADAKKATARVKYNDKTVSLLYEAGCA